MVLPASCPCSMVVTMGNCRHSQSLRHSSELGGGGGGGHKRLVHKDERNYVHQSFVATHKPGKCAVSACADPEGGGGQGVRTPPGKLQKYRVP